MQRLSRSAQTLIALRAAQGSLRHNQVRTISLAAAASSRRSLPVNTVINVVPQQEAWVVERLGKFHSILSPGLNFLIPVVDRIRYAYSLKEMVIDIPSQSGVTQDNVTLHLDGVLYLQISDPYKTSYGVDDYKIAVTQLAQTTMRSEIGKLTLDLIFKERQTLNENIVAAINHAAAPWGMSCMRYEIRDINLPAIVVENMQRQVSAERMKRATILESEGTRQAAINVAQGEKESMVLSSEGARTERENAAYGEATSIVAKANATAEALKIVATAIGSNNGRDAVALMIAQQYVDAFKQLAKKTNTILLPSNPSDPSAMIAQAMAIFQNVKAATPHDNSSNNNSNNNTTTTTRTDDDQSSETNATDPPLPPNFLNIDSQNKKH